MPYNRGVSSVVDSELGSPGLRTSPDEGVPTLRGLRRVGIL
jgi:hypothetical protein